MGIGPCKTYELNGNDEINESGRKIVVKKMYTVDSKPNTIGSIANKIGIFKHHKSQEKNFVNRSLTSNKAKQLKQNSNSINSELSNKNDILKNGSIVNKVPENNLANRLDSLGYANSGSFNENDIAVIDPTKIKIDKTGDYTNYYENISIIGKGSYGEVFKVKSKSNDKIYALKTIPKRVCVDEKKVLSEIEILKGLDHPNIVRIYEYFQDKKNYYLISEFNYIDFAKEENYLIMLLKCHIFLKGKQQ